MSEFILTMSGKLENWVAMSAEEKQKTMEKYYAFVGRLKSENRFKGGSAVNGKGMMLKSGNGSITVDGPYTESKESMNGYFIFEADNMNEAVAIARDCPALTHGETVEVFELSNH